MVRDRQRGLPISSSFLLERGVLKADQFSTINGSVCSPTDQRATPLKNALASFVNRSNSGLMVYIMWPAW